MKQARWITWAIIALSLFSIPDIGAQEKFERGLQQISFIPKGQWITGVSVNYTQDNQDNYQFLIVENISGDAYSFKVSPMLMYSFADNMAAGAKLGYRRTKALIENGSVILDSSTSYDADNLYAINSNFYGTACLRNYISFGNSMRFGLFNELQLELSGGQSKISNGTGDNLTGTFERNFGLNIGLAPGFIMFLNNYSALEVNVGVLGFGYTHTHATTDQVYVSTRNSKHANFKVNLFSISFGVAFYL